MDLFVTTRRQLHGIAELLIAGPQYRQHGTIRLAVRPGGFGGVALPVSVVGTDLVFPEGRIRLTGTIRELAVAANLEPGAPEGLYHDGSGVDLDEPLQIDAFAAEEIASWFTLGDDALRAFAPDQEPVLWPEHFDLAITVDEVNFGVSPGDSAHQAPYSYVGPWKPVEGEFWNAPFGALREMEDAGNRLALTEFFAEGAKLAAQ